MNNSDRLELRAKDPVAQCLIRRLVVPRVYFDADWPGFEHGAVDLLVIDRDGVGDAHLVEIRHSAKAALAHVPSLLNAAGPFRWIAFFKGTMDDEANLALASKDLLYPENSPGRVGIIEIVENGEDLGANVIVSAERFPDAVYDVATAFSGSHKANIQFGE